MNGDHDDGAAAWPLPDAPEEVAQHLRLMASGAPPCRRFARIPPWIKGILNMAAGMIEHNGRRDLH